MYVWYHIWEKNNKVRGEKVKSEKKKVFPGILRRITNGLLIGKYLKGWF